MTLSLKGTAPRIPLLLALFIVLVLAGCGEKLTPEQQVRQFVASATVAAEARDVIGLSDLISENYGDNSRRDRRALIGMTTGYFLRHKNIHLFTQINEIRFPTEQSAKVSLYVGMAGTPVTGAQALIDLRADLVEFDLTLVKESDEWKLSRADWQRATIEDLLSSG